MEHDRIGSLWGDIRTVYLDSTNHLKLLIWGIVPEFIFFISYCLRKGFAS